MPNPALIELGSRHGKDPKTACLKDFDGDTKEYPPLNVFGNTTANVVNLRRIRASIMHGRRDAKPRTFTMELMMQKSVIAAIFGRGIIIHTITHLVYST